MNSLLHTQWRRNRDDVIVEIVADTEASSQRGNRSVLARNLDTNRNFWITPEGLWKKYEQVADTFDGEIFLREADSYGDCMMSVDAERRTGEFVFRIDDDWSGATHVLDETDVAHLMSSLFAHMNESTQYRFLSLIGER
ncbi:hypothetical protein SEA_DATBOI_50 [Gordonia phage DatBoi]|nr:hypothetical protein SEA_DATBOI_50 [Gordonia phage DatBoi]